MKKKPLHFRGGNLTIHTNEFFTRSDLKGHGYAQTYV